MHGLIFIGHSKLPQGSAAHDISETLALSCVVDPRYGVIVEVSCTLVTSSAIHIVEDTLIGQNLIDGVDGAIQEFRERYHGTALPAIEAALKDIQAQWRRWRETQR